MGPGGDIHDGRSHQPLEIINPPISPGHNTTTSSFIAPEHVMDNASKSAALGRGSSMFGVESLEERGNDTSDQDVSGNSDGENHIPDGREGRRRSTLKPTVFARHSDSSLDFSEQALKDSRVTERSPSHQSYRRASPLSTSESLASISQTSHLQGLSLSNSPKSTSTRSFRPSDDESMDEVTSQAIGSSGDDENEPPSEILDSSPQLIMPSIKIPSRRPFTEKGKGIGLLKILIAGDSGMSQRNPPTLDVLKRFKALARRLSSNPLFRLAMISCMLIL